MSKKQENLLKVFVFYIKRDFPNLSCGIWSIWQKSCRFDGIWSIWKNWLVSLFKNKSSNSDMFAATVSLILARALFCRQKHYFVETP